MVRKRSALLTCILAITCAGVPAFASPSTPGVTVKLVPMDLSTGRTDASPLIVEGQSTEAFCPQTPPQTVEGTLLSLDPSGKFAVVRTLRDGDVKMGLPANLYISRDGHSSSLQAMKPGDRIYATVVTDKGVRAIRLVSESAQNPLVNIIGIPILSIMALGLWRVRSVAARSVAK